MPLVGTFGSGASKGFGQTRGGSPYICATGGCVSFCGVYKMHTFNSPTSFVVNKVPDAALAEVEYLVVGAGGGSTPSRSGGGGAGGFRESCGAEAGCYSVSPLAAPNASIQVTVQSYPISRGAGGATGPAPGVGGSGGTSTFSSITSGGGGGGAAVDMDRAASSAAALYSAQCKKEGSGQGMGFGFGFGSSTTTVISSNCGAPRCSPRPSRILSMHSP